jgi:hypothetical protein
MRVVSLVFAVITSALALSVAQAQTVEKSDKAKAAAEATVKPSTAAKPAAQSKAAASETSKSKVEGVSTQRSMPADMKKNTDDCHHKSGNASDA